MNKPRNGNSQKILEGGGGGCNAAVLQQERIAMWGQHPAAIAVVGPEVDNGFLLCVAAASNGNNDHHFTLIGFRKLQIWRRRWSSVSCG